MREVAYPSEIVYCSIMSSSSLYDGSGMPYLDISPRVEISTATI
jgi:hypothetical protein